MIRLSRFLALAVALPLGVVLPAAQAQYAYSVAEIGSSMTYAPSGGMYVDDAGDVAYTVYSGSQNVMLYSGGVSTVLGTGTAGGISNAGTVLGENYGSGIFTLYSNGTSTGLALANNEETYAISPDGQSIAGSVNYSGGNSKIALLSSTGTVISQTQLAASPDEYSNISINNSGEIIGSYFNDRTYNGGTFIESNGTVTAVTAPTLGYGLSLGGLNDSGVVVGSYYNSQNQQQGFTDTNGTMTALTGLGGTSTGAYGINDSGQIVGFAKTAAGATDAVIFQNGAAVDLNTAVNLTGSGFASLNTAYKISSTGDIVGSGTLTSGQYAIFELTPGGGLSAVPEPTTYLLWTVLGLGGLAVWRLRQRKLVAAAT